MSKSWRDIPWRFLGSLCIGLIAIVGVLLLMSLVNKKDQGQTCISLKVIVEGKETFIDQADISTLIQQQYGSVVGKPLSEIPLEKIEKSLLELPYVSNAEVHIDMNGEMKVSVQQRAILLRVINQAGKDFYVDTQGKKIPTTLKYVPHVMVANGYIRETYTKPLEEVQSELVNDLVSIVKQVQYNELWSNQIVQLYVNENKDIEIVPRIGDQSLVIGNADSLDNKLRRLEIFYKHILPKVGTDAYDKVNVKYGDQIVCERRGDWFIDSLQMKLNTR